LQCQHSAPPHSPRLACHAALLQPPPPPGGNKTQRIHRRRFLVFNGSFLLLAAYSAYYVALEPFAGLTWSACTALPMWGAANAFRQGVPAAWAWALALHAFSWLAQIYLGHSLAERRRPALLDSFFQSLVLAPLFVWFELLFQLGYRPALKAEVDARVERSVAAWRAQSEPLVAAAGGGGGADAPAGQR
jgi:uncharacterized membrane protein YGL010W